MNVTIVGAGNMGLAMVGYLALKGEDRVTLYTRKPLPKEMTLKDVEGGVLEKTDNYAVTSSKEEAFGNADIIFCTYPAFLRIKFINEISDYLKAGQRIGFVPGYGGAEYACRDLIKKGVIVFGLQRVPYVARHENNENGVTAGILSKKNTLYLATIPYKYTDETAAMVGKLLDIPCQPLKEYLSITLAPSNPLLHITGMYTAFKDYKDGDTYPDEIPFYEQWTDETSEILFRYDEEVQEICRKLSPLDLSDVVSLPIYYESPTPEAMTKKLQSIESFKAVRVPLKKEGDSFVPDLNSRMFIEDFPFGVCILKAFALMLKVDSPVIDMMLAFYKRLSGIEYFKENGEFGKDISSSGIPQNFGLETPQDILDFYI
ncbi:MAG: hypothetical protein E7515_05185 [Ruminococcaceae bacterium]|jgi:hypothetical protein|nr:hypothetical protein [Oscillospiraceae bacterium]